MEKKIVYIAHPIGGDVDANLKRVIEILRMIMRDDNSKHIIPFAPYWVDCHALDDNEPEERQRGIDNDTELFKRKFIDEVWLFGNTISKGMYAEIRLANSLSIPVKAMTFTTAMLLANPQEPLTYEEEAFG
jgi:hypothetical protein